MALTSSSTFAEAKDQYLANSDYAYAQSVAKARLFAEAVHWILFGAQGASSGNGAEQYNFDLVRLAAQLDRAESWLRLNRQPRQVYGTQLVREA